MLCTGKYLVLSYTGKYLVLYTGEIPGVIIHGEIPGVIIHGEIPGVIIHEEIPGVIIHGEIPGVIVHGEIPGVIVHGEIPGVIIHGEIPGVIIHGGNTWCYHTRGKYLVLSYTPLDQGPDMKRRSKDVDGELTSFLPAEMSRREEKFHDAARMNDAALIRALLKEKVNVNCKNSADFLHRNIAGILLSIGLIEYLTQIINDLPEPSLDNVFSKVVSPKSMLVLAKNPSSEMRLAVMKLLGAYLAKAPPPLIEMFLKMDGFYLLANQLRSFPVSKSHVESAISILVRQDFAFDNNFMIADLGDLSAIQQSAPVLLLSLLENTASNSKLCSSFLAVLCELLESTPTISSLLLDLGLAETMCNLASSIQRYYIMDRKPEDKEVMRLLLVDVQRVLGCTAVSEFSWMGPSHFQNVEDLFTLLKALEDNEFSRPSEFSIKRSDTARAFQISLVVRILDYVEKRCEELSSAPQGWMTSSTASTASSSSLPKSPRLASRQHPLSKSFSPSSSSHPSAHYPKLDSRHLTQDTSELKRSTYSFPDMMAFLSGSSYDDRLVYHGDSDSSGSSRGTSYPRVTESGPKLSRLGTLFSRKKKIIYAAVNQSDLLDRFRKILVTATDLAIMFPREEKLRPTEERTLNFLSEPKMHCLEDRYLKLLFIKVYRFYEHCLSKDGVSKKFRNPIKYGAKDVLRTQFTRLFLCMMSIKVDFELRVFTLAFIMNEQLDSEALKAVISDRAAGTELSFYVYNLLAQWKDWLNSAQREFGFSLMQTLRRSGYTIYSPDHMLTQSQVNVLMEDKSQIDARYRKDLTIWLQKREASTS
ncbi:hypothetical protein Btru_073127, partial [Bulinus truncatus]